jgi:glycosyltransferase involved in cell wall biosynthesis
MGALGIALSGRRSKLLFDIRGLLAEEYTDAGLWPPDGTLFRVAKRVERFLMRRADGFVLLTERIRSVLLSPNDASVDRPIEIIPCCCDVPRLLSDTGNRNEIRARIGAGDRPVIVYVGSFGGWYLSDEMIRFVRTAMEEEPNLFFLVLTQRGTESVRAMLDDAGIKDRDSYVTSVSPQEIGEYLNACDMALSFIKPCMSKRASSPTKLAEYLACGLPVISNSGIGDVDEVLTGERVGVVFDNFDVETYRRAFRDYRGLVRDELTQERCRDVAMRHFDLKTVGGPAYGRLYSRLTKADEL